MLGSQIQRTDACSQGVHSLAGETDKSIQKYYAHCWGKDRTCAGPGGDTDEE